MNGRKDVLTLETNYIRNIKTSGNEVKYTLKKPRTLNRFIHMETIQPFWSSHRLARTGGQATGAIPFVLDEPSDCLGLKHMAFYTKLTYDTPGNFCEYNGY